MPGVFLASGVEDDGGGYKSGCLNLSGGWGWDAHKDVSEMHLGRYCLAGDCETRNE